MELCQERDSWELGKGFSVDGGAWNELLQAVGIGPSCWNSRRTWTLLLDVRFGFGVVLCAARRWTWPMSPY